MPTTTIEAVYEPGVLRLSRPIDLAEGTRVDVIVIPQTSSPNPTKRTPAEIAMRIAAMPMQSSAEGFSGEDHDRILYGDQPRRSSSAVASRFSFVRFRQPDPAECIREVFGEVFTVR